MGFIEKRSEFRVEVRPRAAGDYVWASISGMHRTEKEEERLCEELQREILRHVEGTGRNYVRILWDIEKVCQHCGAAWTEDSPNYNGGCCSEDREEVIANGDSKS